MQISEVNNEKRKVKNFQDAKAVVIPTYHFSFFTFHSKGTPL